MDAVLTASDARNDHVSLRFSGGMGDLQATRGHGRQDGVWRMESKNRRALLIAH